jgi:hypothetical protein
VLLLGDALVFLFFCTPQQDDLGDHNVRRFSTSCLVRRYWLRAAFAVWASRSRPAERLPASLASMNWKTFSNVMFWFLSPRRSNWMS